MKLAYFFLALMAIACDHKVHRGPAQDSTLRSEQFLTANFQSISSLILQPRCVSCHREDSDNAASRTPMVSLKQILDSPRELVIPGNSEESGLVIYTGPDSPKPMPPLTSDKAPLTADEIAILREWIERGAKD